MSSCEIWGSSSMTWSLSSLSTLLPKPQLPPPSEITLWWSSHTSVSMSQSGRGTQRPWSEELETHSCLALNCVLIFSATGHLKQFEYVSHGFTC
jgi:hypothetical protein